MSRKSSSRFRIWRIGSLVSKTSHYGADGEHAQNARVQDLWRMLITETSVADVVTVIVSIGNS